MRETGRVITVVAAVIERGDQILICQRRPNERHALKWEFPGGKVEKGESLEQALERELVEELGIRARIGPEIKRYNFASNGRGGILLVFFRVTEFAGEIQNRIFSKVLWEKRAALPQYAFLEGDIEFVNELAAGSR
jgi:8-oxo-dGTP diphosphatase